VLVTGPGTVTGSVTLQVLPVAVRVTPVIVCAVGFVVKVRMGAHASLAMRLAKSAENCRTLDLVRFC